METPRDRTPLEKRPRSTMITPLDILRLQGSGPYRYAQNGLLASSTLSQKPPDRGVELQSLSRREICHISVPRCFVMTSAEEYKNQGNECLKRGEYEKASLLYTEAIKQDDSNAVYFSNRAQAAIKMEQYGLAISDADRALAIDANYIKAYYRRATAHVGVLDYKKALEDYNEAARHAPNDPAIKSKIVECKRVLRMQAFQRAIEIEDPPSIFETLDLEHIPDTEKTGLAPLDVETLTRDYVFNIVDLFKRGELISRRKVFQIVKAAMALFRSEPTMVELPRPEPDHKVTVCGDTHGQFYDLLNIFNKNGWPSDKHTYVFNGDFVDRGSWSTEIALTLYLFKILLPNNLFINRGNHESDSMNITYGFAGECKAKYNTDNVFKSFSESFSTLPLATLLADQYFIVHGGLFSRDDVTLDEIRGFDRFKHKQPADKGIMMEMLWADPQDQPGRQPSKRGIGLQFGPDVTKAFLDANNLKAIIRSHEVRDKGYSYEHDNRLITVFSAPNYCDSVGNLGAYINFDSSMDPDIQQFEAQPHPNVPAMAYASNLIR